MSASKKRVPFEELSELKGEMKKANITLDEMAKALGRSVSGLCKIFNGDVDIKRQAMKRILIFMNKRTSKNYTMNDLFG